MFNTTKVDSHRAAQQILANHLEESGSGDSQVASHQDLEAPKLVRSKVVERDAKSLDGAWGGVKTLAAFVAFIPCGLLSLGVRGGARAVDYLAGKAGKDTDCSSAADKLMKNYVMGPIISNLD